MMNRIFIAALFVISTQWVQAQCTISLSGHVNDMETKEHLANAAVLIKELKLTQSTNEKGEFLFKGLCPGVYTLEISHIACKTVIRHIHLKADLETDIELAHDAGQLGEIVIMGFSRQNENLPLTEVKGKMLESKRGLSLAESISKVSGVSLLQTGSNIYKPVIHGLHSNRILILNNGVRQEAQQWGGEHAPEIDPYIANRISVIKGASAIRYGGDAIGGVVLVEPKLLRNDPGSNAELNTAFFSNNRMGVLSGMIEGNSAKHPSFSWRLQGTYKRGGFARTPDYILANSASEESNFSVTAGWRKASKGAELFYSQFNTRVGIFSGSHIGNVTDLWNAIQSAEPPDYIRNVSFSYKIDRPYQDVQHHLLKLKAWKNTGTVGRLNLVLSGQYNNRQEFDQKRFASSSNAPQLDMSIGTAITELVWDHYGVGPVRGTIGGSFLYQNNRYERRLFIPNYESVTTGVFIIEKWRSGIVNVEGGMRFDYKQIFNIYDNGNLRNYTDRSFANLSGNLTANFHLGEKWKLITGISTAWRSPQVNELYADGLHHGAARIEKGNAALTPERSNNVSANFVLDDEQWEVEAGLYLKHIDGFIFLEPTFPPELTIRGAFPSFRFSQTNARLTGLDFSATYKMDPHWTTVARASLLRAWDKTQKDWVIQMPADRFETQIEYNLHNSKQLNETYFGFNASWVLQQTRVPATGNIEVPGTSTKQSDYLQPPPAYFLLGIEAGTMLKVGHANWSWIVSVTNLTNLAYRDYMNAFRYFSDEMGRNISLRLKIPIDIKHTHKQ